MLMLDKSLTICQCPLLTSTVALEAIKGEQTIAELGNRYGLHPNMITTWKQQAIDNLAETFSTKAERTRTADGSRNCTPRSCNSRWSGIFLAKAFGR